jgi:capsular polysaccharide biosynthesis protein
MQLSNLINFLNPAAPKGLIATADAWVARRTQAAPQLRHPQPAAWFKQVFPAEDNLNLLEYPLEPTPGEEFTSVRWTASPPAALFYMQGCRVLGDEGAVVSPDNKVFADFTMPPADRWADHSCFRRRRIPPAIPLKGWYATVAWPESKFFFHWMIEGLPRMAVLGEHARAIDGLFVPGPLHPFHIESLKVLGVGQEKLIPLDVASHYQPEHLFIPRTFAMYNPPRWMHEWFKQAFLDPSSAPSGATPARRLYVSRADAPFRRVANEQEVVQLLDRFGFRVVCLSDYPFVEQARLFNDAEMIVAPHGAGLSNLVFCRAGTSLIEVMPPGWMAPCFMALASSVGCHYRHLAAGRANSSGTGNPQRDNVQIPVAALEQLLQAALP